MAASSPAGEAGTQPAPVQRPRELSTALAARPRGGSAHPPGTTRPAPGWEAAPTRPVQHGDCTTPGRAQRAPPIRDTTGSGRGDLTWHGALGHPLGSGLQHLEGGAHRAARGIPRRLCDRRRTEQQQQQPQHRQHRSAAARHRPGAGRGWHTRTRRRPPRRDRAAARRGSAERSSAPRAFARRPASANHGPAPAARPLAASPPGPAPIGPAAAPRLAGVPPRARRRPGAHWPRRAPHLPRGARAPRPGCRGAPRATPAPSKGLPIGPGTAALARRSEQWEATLRLHKAERVCAGCGRAARPQLQIKARGEQAGKQISLKFPARIQEQIIANSSPPALFHSEVLKRDEK